SRHHGRAGNSHLSDRRHGSRRADSGPPRRRSGGRLPGIIRCFDSTQRTAMISKLRTLITLAVFMLLGLPALVLAQAPAPERAGEANLVLPDLSTPVFQGINGRPLLMGGLLICVLGLAFGMTIFYRLKNMPVHRSMLEVSELIYETCKTYLITQGKFILIL